MSVARIRRIPGYTRRPSGLTPELERLAREAGIPVKVVRVRSYKRRAAGGRPRKNPIVPLKRKPKGVVREV